jgi:hypothetical protein
VGRTLAQRRPGQDNVTVLSVTVDSGALGEWIPPQEENVFPAPFSSLHVVPAPSAQPGSSAGKAWLIAAIFLLLVAIGFAGLWYFSSH